MFRIDRRNPHIRNVFSLILFSLVFLSAIQSIAVSINIFTFKGVLSFLSLNKIIIAVAIATFYVVNKFKKYSKFFVAFYSLLILINCSAYLLTSFNKLILIFVFIYLLFAFFFYTDWELFLDLAANTPNYSQNDLEKEKMFNIDGHLILEKSKINFKITNLDEYSCFVLLEKNEEIILGKLYEASVKYENVVFSENLRCVSIYKNGAGFIFEGNNTRHNMSGLYQVCLDRGFFN